MKRKPSDRISNEEVLAMEISEDKRLRESGIDPNGDPVEIMTQVRLRMEKRRKRGGGNGRKWKSPYSIPPDPPRHDA
jgi:hypothetical protein